jgi:NAD+ synthase (glutamine-hydrolysing)
MIATRAQDEIAYVAYVNQIGGQDELVFEGGSMIYDGDGEAAASASSFEEDLLVADLDVDGVVGARLHDTRRRQMTRFEPAGSISVQCVSTPLSGPRDTVPRPMIGPRVRHGSCSGDAEVYAALVLGVRDYVRKSGVFEDVVIALSGGIDSSLTAAVAVDALGADHVIGVSMPTRFSSEHSKSDAAALATNLGIRILTISIEDPFTAMLAVLEEPFRGCEQDTTEENLQARIRGNILMALSNKFNWLALTTGNKSEVAVGFSTLYGDTAGGFAVLKDVYKTTLYRLARWKNQQTGSDLIPAGVLTKPPSAELRADQLDADRLPAYELLDPILRAYVEDDRSVEDIVALGQDREVVEQVVRLVDVNEFKRRQQPPGPRISARAFGKDRRLPITNRYGR